MRRAVRIAVPVVLVAAGVLALLLSRDVAHWQHALPADDTRLRVAPADRLWHPSQLFPFAAAPKLLGIRDDLTYRRTLQVLALSEPHRFLYTQSETAALRAEAQLELTGIARTDPDRSRQSAALNFLGGLALATMADDETARVTLLRSAVDSFRSAVGLDPANDDAKYDLELALTRLRAAQASVKAEQNPGNASAGTGAGVGRAGTGY